MERIRVILAQNIKYFRKKLGLTQPQLAEKANISTNYIALIETCNKYPKPEMLERLAEALDIQSYQLFTPIAAPEGALLHREELELLRHEIIEEINMTVNRAIKKSFAEQIKKK